MNFPKPKICVVFLKKICVVYFSYWTFLNQMLSICSLTCFQSATTWMCLVVKHKLQRTLLTVKIELDSTARNIKRTCWVRDWQLSLVRQKIILRLWSRASRMEIMPNTSRGHCKPPAISATLTEKICTVLGLQVRWGIGLSVKRMQGIGAVCTWDLDSVKR
jgi:hypothetical protein